MMRAGVLVGLVAALSCSFALAVDRSRELTFAERVEAQAAIERAAYAHQIGSTLPFEKAVPHRVLERKVETYLRESLLLERRWHEPVTAEALKRETERILSRTQAPERLREVFAALGNDPVLIQECLARPALVDRLARSFQAAESRSSASSDERAPESWDSWWDRTAPTLDARAVTTIADPEACFPAAGSGRDAVTEDSAESVAPAAPCTDNTWSSMSADAPMAGAGASSSVWTGSRLFVWNGIRPGAAPDGWLYDPVIDTWSLVSSVGAPVEQRTGYSVVWVAGRVVVWGGHDPAGQPGAMYNTGARYDPLTDTWSPMSTTSAPAARFQHTGAAVGGVMIIWGATNPASGGRYDPATDTWMPMSTVGAPLGSSPAVSTGSELVIWTGYGDATHPGGARYNPATDTWQPMSTAGAPSPRVRASVVWTGSKVIFWSGALAAGGYTTTGGIYDPATDSWQPTGMTLVPSGRDEHSAIWTGTEMIVWGGNNSSLGGVLGSGNRYDPSTGVWTFLSNVNAPSPRYGMAAAWTGSRMLIYGGYNGQADLNTGGRYNPASDSWTPTSTGTVPEARRAPPVIWTGTQMIVWGGDGAGGLQVNTGGRYDPMLDAWTPTSLANAPSARRYHTMVWTGQQMIVWGGQYPVTNTGGRYDPIADSWSPTELFNAPEPRVLHAAVWTGSVMVILGGRSEYPSGTNVTLYKSGGRYDPVSDTWTATSTTGAPPDGGAPAVWTGQVMVISGNSFGGQYNPVTDSWTSAPGGLGPLVWTGQWVVRWSGPPGGFYSGLAFDPVTGNWFYMPTAGAPPATTGFSMIWNGSAVIVWGGADSNGPRSDGGVFDIQTGTWAPLGATGTPPTARSEHAAVWTGSEMLVWGGLVNGQLLNTGGRLHMTPDSDQDGDGYTRCGGDCNDTQASIHPGVVDVCDTIDNDCDGVVDEGVDADGDGHSTCASDCNDSDGAVWTAPVDVTGLAVNASSPSAIGWDDQSGASGPGTGYSVVSGTVGSSGGVDFFAAACLGGVSAPPFQDARVSPAAGTAYWYLVRASNSCGSGTYGTAQRDAQIPACP
ncbi:MAG TPA: MopE-related protein [Candidatus Polarisedimenticolia bacterium]|jgi:N-acetylneuraminic acid mutarotase|nr:MopE-related protein [Candidatus Polarisedimenticolia bacterium]